MEKQYFGKSSKAEILLVNKLKPLLILLLCIFSACQKGVRKTPKNTLKASTPNMHIVTRITSDGDTSRYELDDNNRILYIGGYLSDLDRTDTIFYKFLDNRLIGFHYASGMKSAKSDSLEIINSINAQYQEYLWLKQKGIRFRSPDMDKEEIHDIYTILSNKKEIAQMKAGDSQTFEIRASYGRDSFGIIINGLLNSDSRLYKLQLSVDKKNRIVQEIYYFNDTKISRAYDYNPMGYLVRVYQDGEIFYRKSYEIAK